MREEKRRCEERGGEIKGQGRGEGRDRQGGGPGGQRGYGENE